MVSLVNTLKNRPIILLFGDSITQQGFGWEGAVGWASLLASDYSRRADVWNRGFSGYNTRHALDVVDDIFGSIPLQASPVLFCTVFFGANDAALPGERQYVPINEYRANLQQIISGIRERAGKKDSRTTTTTTSTINGDASCEANTDNELPIILMTPPPVDMQAWCRDRDIPVPDRANDVARSYGLEAQQVANEMSNCSILDVWTLLGGNESADVYGKHLRDGLHLSESGNRLVHAGLMQLLQRDYPHLVPMLDGNGKYGEVGVPLQGKLWSELC